MSVPGESCRLGLIALLTLMPTTAAAQHDDEAASRWYFISPVGRLFEPSPTGDPDEPGLRFSFFGSRKEAMAGGQLMLAGRRAPSLDLAINVSGFIALVNFDEHHAMPWQSFRGYLGLNTMWRSRWLDRRLLPEDGSLMLELGYFHESDHAVDVVGFIATFLDQPWIRFDNGNFSSFEFFKLKLRYRQRFAGGRVEWINAVGLKVFTPSLNPWDRRELRSGLSVESRAFIRLVRRLFLDVGVYYETLANDFVSAENNIRFDLDHTPLQYLRLETGLWWRSPGGQMLGVSLLLLRSHGRGLDFAARRDEWGLDVRVQL